LEVVTKEIYPLKCLLLIVYAPSYSVDYFRKITERDISVVI